MKFSKCYFVACAILALVCPTGIVRAQEAVSTSTALIEKIPLWSGKAPVRDGQWDENIPIITVHHPAKPNGKAIVICPGGGYGMLMKEQEGHGIARWLNGHGITGVVLEYRLPAGRKMVPLLDAQRAIRFTRANAATWGLDPARIGIMGFSAGGHLASTADVHFDGGNADSEDLIDRVSCRPDFAILVYPVVTMNEKTHGGSRSALLGNAPTQEEMDFFSAEKQVTDQTPPTFVTHAQDDTVVDPINSENLYQALKAKKIPTEYLKLASGGHGLTGFQGPMWDAWQKRSMEWLKEIFTEEGT